MAKSKLTTCKSCGHEISTGSKVTCPNCGKVSKKPFYTRIWFIALALIVFIGAASSLGGGDDKTPSGQGSTVTSGTNAAIVSTTPATSAKPMIVSSDDLVTALKENALGASKKYKGQYVELTGKLSVIDSSGKYFSLAPLDDDFSFTSIRCDITKDMEDTVANFKKEQEVTVIGTISDVGEIMGYSLDVENIK